MLVSLGHVVSGSKGGGQLTFRMLGPRGINVPNSLALFSLSGLVLCVLASNSLATDGALHGTRSLAADSYGSQKSNLEILKSRMPRGKEVALLLLQNKPEDTQLTWLESQANFLQTLGPSPSTPLPLWSVIVTPRNQVF